MHLYIYFTDNKTENLSPIRTTRSYVCFAKKPTKPCLVFTSIFFRKCHQTLKMLRLALEVVNFLFVFFFFRLARKPSFLGSSDLQQIILNVLDSIILIISGNRITTTKNWSPRKFEFFATVKRYFSIVVRIGP